MPSPWITLVLFAATFVVFLEQANSRVQGKYVKVIRGPEKGVYWRRGGGLSRAGVRYKVYHPVSRPQGEIDSSRRRKRRPTPQQQKYRRVPVRPAADTHYSSSSHPPHYNPPYQQGEYSEERPIASRPSKPYSSRVRARPWQAPDYPPERPSRPRKHRDPYEREPEETTEYRWRGEPDSGVSRRPPISSQTSYRWPTDSDTAQSSDPWEETTKPPRRERQRVKQNDYRYRDEPEWEDPDRIPDAVRQQVMYPVWTDNKMPVDSWPEGAYVQYPGQRVTQNFRPKKKKKKTVNKELESRRPEPSGNKWRVGIGQKRPPSWEEDWPEDMAEDDHWHEGDLSPHFSNSWMGDPDSFYHDRSFTLYNSTSN